jgi:Polysaccharide lyase
LERAGIIVVVLCLLVALAALIAQVAGGGDLVQLGSTPAPGCPPSDPPSNPDHTVSECKLVRSDTGADPNAHHLWGDRYACASNRRVSNPRSGGDPGPTAMGTPQGDTAYRELKVFDGDNYSGERCELGYNTWDDGLANPSDEYGTFYNYFEGDRRTTYFSVRLPDNFPLDAKLWQGVGQMKQAAPNDDPSLIPVLSFSAYKGVWSFWHTNNGASSDAELWETPAQKNVWTRIEVDAYYSQDPSKGWVQYTVNGVQSPVFRTNTLHRNGSGSSNDELPAGASIPSHLRLGLYHNPSIPCPPPSGCSLDIDNVQVLEP